jgi:hypothetical protein
MDLETKFKKETGLDAYMDNDLRPKVYRDYYVEWLEKQLTISGGVGRSEQLCGNLDKNLNCKNMCLTHCIDGNKFWK